MKKPKFNKHSVADVVRLTNIAYVTDAEIWRHLITPIAKSFIGPIESYQVCSVETEKGLFPGDEVANLNDHQLYGGQPGFLRFPYLHTFYKTANGAFIIKRDGVKFEAIGWWGDVTKGRGKLMFKLALRDRSFDGTRAANDSGLVDFPYDDPVLNGRLLHDLKSCEVSVYGFLPGSRIVDKGLKEYDQFVEKPFAFLDRPELFLNYFKIAWDSECAPGQSAAPIPDISRIVASGFEKIALKHRYDVLESAASHYHVAMWARSLGYRYTRPETEQVMTQFAEGIKRLKASAVMLSRAQESWLCVVQSLPGDLIPEGLYLGGITWPQDNIGPANLWMYKPLSEKAKRLLP